MRGFRYVSLLAILLGATFLGASPQPPEPLPLSDVGVRVDAPVAAPVAAEAQFAKMHVATDKRTPANALSLLPLWSEPSFVRKDAPEVAAEAPVPAPMPRVKATGDFLTDWRATLPVGQEAKPNKGEAPAFQLGRAKPLKQYDYGKFRAVVGTDGKTRYFPRLAKHVDTALRAAPLPVSVNYGLKAPNVLKQMYGNDQQGDCVIASRYHRVGIALANDTGKELQSTTAEVLKTYHSWCGGGDNGCNMSAVNQLEQSRGIPFAGMVHKTDGAVSVDHTNVDLIKTAIIAFGNLEVGLSLPSAWHQSADGSDWGITNTGIVGGHEVHAFGFDDKGVWISTWGGVRRILWAAFTSSRWIDEVYTTLAVDWYGADGVAANGITKEGLKADLVLVAAGEIPPLPDPTPTPPVPGRLALIATPAAGMTPLTVTFTSTGNAIGASLNFGDGSTPTVLPATHTYTAAGNYTATLKTATETATAIVSVGVVPPVPGVLGSVTTDPQTGTIAFVGPWRIKGGVVPSLKDELLADGIAPEVVEAVLTLIAATKKAAVKP